MKLVLALSALALVLVACAEGTSVSTVAPVEPPSASQTSGTTPETQTPEQPAETAASGPQTYAAGDVVTITQNGEDWATVTVSDVAEKASYGEFDKAGEGNTFISAKVAYEAIQDGVDYNPFDWQVFVDGSAVDNLTFVSEGPKPDLSSGTLPAGRKAEGYVIYEVPEEGEVRMSYGNTFGDEAPVFEVVIREE